MSNPHPDRPIAQPRRRLNRTTSTNSVGSVGSATGSTSPLANFSFGSPSSVTAAKPPVQPALGSFGASNPPGFNTQPNNNIGFQSGFGSPMANPPVTSTNTPTIGFGAFGSPSVPSTATNQPFGGLGSQNNTSTSSSSSSIGAFGSIPTSNAGGFQSGFGNTSGSLFSGFGKPSQPQEIDDDNDSNMDSDEQPAAAQIPSFGGFGSSKPQTSTPAFSLNTSNVTTEQNKSTSAFPAFSFGKPATSSESTTTPKPFESSSSASPFSFKPTSFNEPKDADTTKETASTQKPSAGFGFGSLNKTPLTSTTNASTLSFGTKAPEEKSDKSAAPSPFASFGTPSKSTPSPFTGFGQPTSSAKITEISSPESNDEVDGDSSKSTSSKPAATIITPTFSFNTPSAKSAEEKPKEDNDKSSDKPTVSFGSFTNTSEKKSDETATPAFFKKSDIPSTFAGLKSASEVSSPSSVIANAASPAPTAIETSSSEKEETASKATTSTDGNSSEKEAVTSLFGQRRNSITSTTSDTSIQAVAAASPSPFASITKETDKSTESSKTIPAFGSFGKSTTEGFSITKSTDSTESGSSFFGKPQKKPETVANDAITEENDSSAKKDDKKPTFSFGNVAPAASLTEKPTSSPFSFNKPAETADKPSPFTFNTTSASSTDKAAAAPKPFSFGTNASSTTDKAEAPKSFLFNAPAPTGEKPSPFSFGSPASSSADKPASSFSFSSPVATSSDSSSRKKRDRDADDDNNNDEQAHKKSLSFSPNPKSKSTSASTPGFSFSTGAVGSKDTSSPFNYVATPVTKSTENAKEDTVVPTFTFGKSAPTTEKKDAGSSIFTFGAPATKATENIEKKDTPKSFSFDSPATTTAPGKKNFSFGAPPSTDTSNTEGAKDKSAADSKKPTFSFGSPASASSFGDKSSADKANDTTSSKTDNVANGTTLLHGKSPLSKSTSFLANEASSKDNESDKNSTAGINKRVSFSLPGASSATNASTTKTSEPGSVSLAFSKVKGTDDTTTPATLNLHPIAKKDTSSSGTTLQTTLKSTITDSSQITYKTRFWELPDDARNELALLAHFITEQTDKKDKIDQELGSYFGSTLKEMHASALTMNDDAVILGEQLEVQSKSIDDLILLNKEQRLNAASASNVQQQESKNWRMRGATENWNFFNSSIANMEQRFGQLSETVTSVEEAINGLQSQVQFSPQNVGTMLDQQRRMYLSLAGRVAEIHQEADRIVKRRKLTK